MPRHAFVVAQSATATPAKPLPGNPSPPYPGQALEAGVEGECVFRADVTPEGTVSKVAVLQVPKEGLGFETAVEKTVAAWHFEPARRGGTKTASVYVGTINYSLLSVNLGRMYSLSASLTWKKLLEWIERTGLKTKEVDPAHQLVLTKLINVRGGPLPFPKTVGSGYVPRRFQIQVFVSPYAEPARVYVASLVEADRRTGAAPTYGPCTTRLSQARGCSRSFRSTSATQDARCRRPRWHGRRWLVSVAPGCQCAHLHSEQDGPAAGTAGQVLLPVPRIPCPNAPGATCRPSALRVPHRGGRLRSILALSRHAREPAGPRSQHPAGRADPRSRRPRGPAVSRRRAREPHVLAL